MKRRLLLCLGAIIACLTATAEAPKGTQPTAGANYLYNVVANKYVDFSQDRQRGRWSDTPQSYATFEGTYPSFTLQVRENEYVSTGYWDGGFIWCNQNQLDVWEFQPVEGMENVYTISTVTAITVNDCPIPEESRWYLFFDEDKNQMNGTVNLSDSCYWKVVSLLEKRLGDLNLLIADARALFADETLTEGRDDFEYEIDAAESAAAGATSQNDVENAIASLQLAIRNFHIANATTDRPAEVWTCTYLDSFDGWIATATADRNNGGNAWYKADNGAVKWGSGDSNSLAYVLKDLPAGTYSFAVDVACTCPTIIFMGTESDELVKMDYNNGTRSTCTLTYFFSSDIPEIRVGLRDEEGSAGWTSANNFRVLYFGSEQSFGETQAMLKEYLAEAQQLIDEKLIPTTAANNLKESIDGMSGPFSSLEEVETAVYIVKTALDEANTFVQPYAKFNDKVTEADSLINASKIEAARTNLVAVLATAKEKAEAAETVESLQEATKQLSDAIIAFHFAEATTDNPQTVVNLNPLDSFDEITTGPWRGGNRGTNEWYLAGDNNEYIAKWCTSGAEPNFLEVNFSPAPAGTYVLTIDMFTACPLELYGYTMAADDDLRCSDPIENNDAGQVFSHTYVVSEQADSVHLGVRDVSFGWCQINSLSVVYSPSTDPSGIDNVNSKSLNADNRMFDLMGRRMDGRLPKGIYIRNGKKVVVR